MQGEPIFLTYAVIVKGKLERLSLMRQTVKYCTSLVTPTFGNGLACVVDMAHSKENGASDAEHNGIGVEEDGDGIDKVSCYYVGHPDLLVPAASRL